MTIDKNEWSCEKQRLELVMNHINRQLKAASNALDKRRERVNEARESLWDALRRNSDDMGDMSQPIQELSEQQRDARVFADLLGRLRKMAVSPYFGRVDFREPTSDKRNKIYIGISGLADKETGKQLVYDWRAPISSMFYDYGVGPAGYHSEAGFTEGEILLKRQYKIANGKILYMFDSNLKIDDEILQEILGKSADTKMRNIVETIQREQNKAIRDDSHKLLIVQGPAGSGKTSIALHRAAYLLYRHRKTLSAKNIVIFSPNRIFSDYISDVLPDLGEENVVQTTFQEYAESALGPNMAVEDMNSQMEFLLSTAKNKDYDIRVESIRYKTSREFAQILEAYVDYLEKEKGTTFADIKYNEKTVIPREDLHKLFNNSYSYLPFARRLLKLKRRILYLLEPRKKDRIKQLIPELRQDPKNEGATEWEIKRQSIEVVNEELEPLLSTIESMTATDIFSLYIRLFEDMELLTHLAANTTLPRHLDKICALTLEKLNEKVVLYEDVAPILFLKGQLEGAPSLANIRHVIIDEAQDYSPLHYKILSQLFPHSHFTILGDLNQAIHPYINIESYDAVTHAFEGVSTEIISLRKSYRSTSQIVAFSKSILTNTTGIETVERPGELPRLICVPDKNTINDAICRGVQEVKDKGAKSIAIICKTAEEAFGAYKALSKSMEVKPILSGDQPFVRGTVIMPSYLSKGLEFDAVLLYNASENHYNSEEERKLLYTACTRALHFLYIYYIEKPSPLIAGIDPGLYTLTQMR